MKKGKSHSGKRWRDDDRWSIDSDWSSTAMIYAASGRGSFALSGDCEVATKMNQSPNICAQEGDEDERA